MTGPEADGGGRDPSDADETVVRDDEDVLREVSGPTPLSETLGHVLGRRGWRDRLRGAAIHSRWEEIVGVELAQRCRPVRLAGGILVVRVPSSAWATQVGYLETTILERARSIVGDDLVREIRVTVGPSEEDR